MLVQHVWCTKIYGKNYSCQPINLNKKCKKGIEYKLDFYNKYITRTGLAIKKVKYGHEFVDWFKNESRVRIPNNQDIINICRECMKNYDKRGNQSKKFYMFIFVFYKTRK